MKAQHHKKHLKTKHFLHSLCKTDSLIIRTRNLEVHMLPNFSCSKLVQAKGTFISASLTINQDHKINCTTVCSDKVKKCTLFVITVSIIIITGNSKGQFRCCPP